MKMPPKLFVQLAHELFPRDLEPRDLRALVECDRERAPREARQRAAERPWAVAEVTL